jgi:hypothetical protein
LRLPGRRHAHCRPDEGVSYDGDIMALVLLTAAPHRVCPACLAKRARLGGKAARDRIGLLAESNRFGVRPGLCCVCTNECLTLGVAEHPEAAA